MVSEGVGAEHNTVEGEVVHFSGRLCLPSVRLIDVDDVAQSQRWNTGVEQPFLQQHNMNH